MNDTSERLAESDDKPGSLLALALLALLIGALSGLLGASFRLALGSADRLRYALIVWAHGEKLLGFLVVILVCALATGLASRLSRKYSPFSAGSGITHVEAVLNGDLPQAPFRLVPLKFIGGTLAIGSGLALGPEGPSVQMAASTAHFVGKVFRRNWPDCRVLVAAGAGAGLAAVFNAPIAGAVFVLEELVRRFETRIAIAALGASATAIWIARMLTGAAPEFHVAPLYYEGAGTGLLYLGMGILMGFLGIVFNRTLIGTLEAADRVKRWPVEIRAGLIGGVVGMLAMLTPRLVGTGESLIQLILNGGGAFWMLLLVYVFRLGLGAVSYAAATPGGLLAPILTLGVLSGMLSGYACKLGFSGLAIQPEAFAIVGMAAFMTAVARTPITAIVLVLEMTGSFTMFLPMLGSCFTAMIVPTILDNDPLYDSLRTRTLRIH